LDIEERAMCAAFVAENRFDAKVLILILNHHSYPLLKASQDLARSTKEIPEDILAFKFYRNV